MSRKLPPLGSGPEGLLEINGEFVPAGWMFHDEIRGLQVCGGGKCFAFSNVVSSGDVKGGCMVDPRNKPNCVAYVVVGESLCPLAAQRNYETLSQALEWIEHGQDRGRP